MSFASLYALITPMTQLLQHNETDQHKSVQLYDKQPIKTFQHETRMCSDQRWNRVSDTDPRPDPTREACDP